MKEDAKYSSVGISHYGRARYGIQAGLWSTTLGQLEKIPSSLREQGIMDSLPAILIDGDVDCRVNVYTLDFDRLKKQLEKV